MALAYNDMGKPIQDERDGFGVKHQFEGNDLVETTRLNHFTIRYQHQEDGTVII